MSRARPRGLDRVDRVPALRLVSGAVPSTPEALIEQAEGAEGDERWELARELYERALHRLNPGAHATLASSLLLAIGRTHHATGNADAALDCVEAALTAAVGQEDATSAGYALNLRALVHWELGEFDAAEREHAEARTLALRAGDARLAAIAERHLGALAMLRGDFDGAARHYETSVAELRAIGDAADLCAALGALGDVYGDQERWELADGTLSEAAQIGSVLGDLDILLAVELRRAESWLARGELDLARQSHDRVAELARRLRDPAANVRLMRLAGVLARELGELDRAESLLADAERTASERHDLLLAAESARERAELLRRQERHRDTLQALNRAYRLLAQVRGRSSAVEVARRAARLERDFLDVVRRWGQSIEAKDLNTHGHCERVADLACAIAERMGVDRRSLFWYRIGALLHDVGKLVVPPEVLNKPGRLTEAEWSLVKRHPVAGAEMLHGVDFPWEVRPIVESHHECWDGSGYPHGLLGEATPLSARIVCVADVYDVLTSQRSFKRALTHDEAMVVMRRDVGRQFDPAVFRVFEDVMAERAGDVVASTSVVAPADVDAGTVREDALTGTLQRSAFFAAATAALAERRGSARTVSMLLVDVDDLGHVNESYGRAQGDDVLWAVSQVLQHGLRSGDLVGRHGADEFAVLLPDASIEKAAEVAQRMVDAVGRLAVRLRDSHDEATLQVSVSVGCATAPRHGDTSAMLVAAADRALYEARSRGPGAVVSAADNAPVAPAARLVFDRFVGRTAELRRLAQALDSSARGRWCSCSKMRTGPMRAPGTCSSISCRPWGVHAY
jgi:diguanylate cyclase (GGDEF)-like protein/putative nucleotidyltransferase with HDIG domain